MTVEGIRAADDTRSLLRAYARWLDGEDGADDALADAFARALSHGYDCGHPLDVLGCMTRHAVIAACWAGERTGGLDRDATLAHLFDLVDEASVAA